MRFHCLDEENENTAPSTPNANAMVAKKDISPKRAVRDPERIAFLEAVVRAADSPDSNKLNDFRKTQWERDVKPTAELPSLEMMMQRIEIVYQGPSKLDLQSSERQRKRREALENSKKKSDALLANLENAIGQWKLQQKAHEDAIEKERQMIEAKEKAAVAQEKLRQDAMLQREAAAKLATEEAQRQLAAEAAAAEAAKLAPPPKTPPSGASGQFQQASEPGSSSIDIPVPPGAMLLFTSIMSSNPQFKGEFFKKRMQVTKAVGQITNSRRQIMDVAKRLDSTFKEGKQISPDLSTRLLDFTAKSIAKQADTEVAVQRLKAFPIAMVCVLLFEVHPPVLSILLGRLMKRCPYVVPMYFKKLPGETPDQFAKRCRYKIADADGNLETEDQYNE
ncbi:hypothetical protein HDU76_008283, partial [Blyttiomyces sp. JEL0837]